MDVKAQTEIEVSSQLITAWNEITKEFTAVQFKVNKEEWLNLIEAIESQTVVFMEKNKVDNIQELWIKL
ncbi:hypothetical protein ACFSTH_07100 [Paenibacillus yanchengensis]|uniref:Uncharacterized protein n=1 Tax=Paenibacillus yanchengensis TaxID=2035833 RepID=A0ABW4YIE1_9BACL